MGWGWMGKRSGEEDVGISGRPPKTQSAAAAPAFAGVEDVD